MGYRDLVLFYVVTGVSLRWIASASSIGPSSIVVWLGAWLFFYIPLVVSVTVLSARYPEEGGLYTWTKNAFGELPGFLAAWIYWNSNLPYFPAVLYFAASNVLYLRIGWAQYSHNRTYFVLFSVVTLIALTVLNVIGLGVARWSYNIGALAMWLPVGIVVVMGLISFANFGSATPFSLSSLRPSVHMHSIIFWSTIVFAFGGCETASFMAAEIENPSRNIPRALFVAGITITCCYVIGTICVLITIPSSEISNLDGLVQAISKAAARLGLHRVTETAAILIAVSNVGAAAAYLASAARLPFVAGIDGFLPQAFSRLHPRWGTPHAAVMTQGVIGILFVFLGQAGTSVKGAYDVLVDIGVITYLVPYLFLFASLIKLQGDVPSKKAISIPFGKVGTCVVAITGLLTTTAAIVLSVIPPPEDRLKFVGTIKIVGSTTVLIGVGLIIYWIGKNKAPRTMPRK